MHLFPFKVPQDSEDYSNFVELIEEEKNIKDKVSEKKRIANAPPSSPTPPTTPKCYHGFCM